MKMNNHNPIGVRVGVSGEVPVLQVMADVKSAGMYDARLIEAVSMISGRVATAESLASIENIPGIRGLTTFRLANLPPAPQFPSLM